MNETNNLVTFIQQKEGHYMKVERNNIEHISNYVGMFRDFLLASGFAPETINEYLPEVI